ncbi:MAG: hypothetical protein IPK78_19990 [Rhodospirillales bacterium]|nr:hypothetical protein [Rhodospirillales bacterium]
MPTRSAFEARQEGLAFAPHEPAGFAQEGRRSLLQLLGAAGGSGQPRLHDVVAASEGT